MLLKILCPLFLIRVAGIELAESYWLCYATAFTVMVYCALRAGIATRHGMDGPGIEIDDPCGRASEGLRPIACWDC